MLHKYKNILEPDLACIKGIQAKLTLKDGVNSVFLKSRKVPFKLLPLVEKEIQALTAAGVLEKVATASWATQIVPVL